MTPSARTPAGYRRYSAADDRRLGRICRYRQAGLPLAAIAGLLDSPDTDLAEVLAARLEALNREIRELREQQRFILAYLSDRRLESLAFMTARRFVELLNLAGVSEAQQDRWHAMFEHQAAEEHQAFLEFLCLPDADIERIRRSAAGTPVPSPPPGRGGPSRPPVTVA